ncbi:toxin-antitoxin system HicB family antitoxin [Subtercola endophyticus]|uniref:toxin-antitoxin system HicB family antitoxin n=1 Tax=Subtercola endophyticus TaxID=2895559 RepID=UPI001E40FF2D|nr:toxin-antitoxin system HicB family antitoxin [Subtercola endophyticus]UFS58798.1 toxin-antitoxin system HicB family antitoxin [Subtercola endophyticus]
MELERYVAELRQQLASAAASGGEATRALAEQLSFSLDAATRLVLLEALSEAAGEITREIAPGSVEVRLRGRDPEFAVSVASQPVFAERSAGVSNATSPDAAFGVATPLVTPRDVEPALEASQPDGIGADLRDDVSTSRTTLRLPDQLKGRVEKAAAHEGLSLNTWLVRAIADALEPKARRGAQKESRSNNSFTGWAR